MRRSTEFLILTVSGTAGGSAYIALTGNLTLGGAADSAIVGVSAALGIVFVRPRRQRKSPNA
ncbi:hypothetical protein [Streptomyces prunicolor]|uniref:hypothetical protein n=1 Tax=Streptomyces prunicolor TaxID=67348 RepID=UPI0003728D33|nr:hypothetical protein [Streptomyces prunicolor]